MCTYCSWERPLPLFACIPCGRKEERVGCHCLVLLPSKKQKKKRKATADTSLPCRKAEEKNELVPQSPERHILLCNDGSRCSLRIECSYYAMVANGSQSVAAGALVAVPVSTRISSFHHFTKEHLRRNHPGTNMDYATLTFDLDAGTVSLIMIWYSYSFCFIDLTSLFTWNTKQLFIYVTAEYESQKNVGHQRMRTYTNIFS